MTTTTQTRYAVAVVVGEGNNIAYVVDSYGPNDTDWEVAESFSTSQDGASWRDRAVTRCAELNAAHALRLAGERARLHRYNVEAGRPTDD